MKGKYLFLSLILLLTACSSLGKREQLREMKENAITFKSLDEELPKDLISVFNDYEFLLIGETHYVEEHLLFVNKLLKSLYSNGRRYYMVEIGYAEGLYVDYYIKSKTDFIPDDYLNMNKLNIEFLREFNRQFDIEEEMISYIPFDVNHNSSDFYKTVKFLSEFYNSEDLKNFLLDLDKVNADTKEYTKVLNEFYIKNMGKIEEVHLKNEISKLLETEIDSVKYRTERSSYYREDYLWKRTLELIESLKEDEKILMNVGSWHAQLKPIWQKAKDLEWLGERLQKYYEDDTKGLYSFSITALKGSTKYAFFANFSDEFEIDLTDKNSFLGNIYDEEKDFFTFVDFTTLENKKEEIKFHYIGGGWVEVKPNEHFNGILVYPLITPQKSIEFFQEKFSNK